MTLPIEDQLEGKYEILEKIGEGGIGSVYKVRHRLLDEIRVIKVLRPQVAAKEDHQERFLHEARMAIRLKHPNIAQLHDFSISSEGTAFIVMEFIDGIALDELLKASGPPSLDLSLEISLQALLALGYLHAHDLVHRDVSPDNLMLTTSFDGTACVKLIDLGIAKNLASETSLTQTGVFLGKVRYCSPEQFSSADDQSRQLDHRSDIYSFGLLLYELLTGVYPFKGETFAELAGCHLFQPPISFDETDPDGKVPEALRAVVLRAVEKDPEARFAGAGEFAESLLPFRNTERPIDEELSRTVERTSSAIPNLKDYARPGSTQDRLNAEFGLGKTTGPRKLSAIAGNKTAAAASKLSASAPSKPAGRSFRWIWASGIAAGVVVILGAVWLGFSPRSQTADGGADEAIESSSGPPIEIAQSERFSFPDPDPAGSIDLNSVPPPPLPEDAVAQPQTAPGPEFSLGPPPGDPQLQQRDRRPPPPEPGAGKTPQQGQPAQRPMPGQPGGPPIGRTAEVYEVGVGVIPPVPARLAEPIYPDGKKPRSEIEVDVAVLVDEYGKVLTARVESGPTFRRRYRDAAVETATRSLFRPAMKNGIAGRMWTNLKIVFEAE